jgi:two-component system, NtrC family, response regulator AtoC
MTISAQVLVVDDEPLIRQSLRTALQQEGFNAEMAASSQEAWERFRRDRPDIVLLDLMLGDADGFELLEGMKQEAPETKIIVVTAHGSIQRAVAAIKHGAYDFIKKPFDLAEIIATVGNAARTSALEQRVEYLAQKDRRRRGGDDFVCAAPATRRLLHEVEVIAASPVPVVLVTGESGAGKQLISRMLHDRSARAAGPFVELNCSAIPENLVESELFGHERGAFSDARERKPGLVEIADGGTLFLDEVGDLGQGAQAKLLTFIEQRTFRRLGATVARKVDVRIVAATNRDLVAAVAARSFREDLWYRLNALTVRLPPLRERREDIGPLAENFLLESSAQFNRRWKALAPETIGLLERARWPGNVRELKAVISRAALMHDHETLQPAHLPAELVASALAGPDPDVESSSVSSTALTGIPTLAEIELAHIKRVLQICDGNRTAAAQHLGITRQTLARKIGANEE